MNKHLERIYLFLSEKKTTNNPFCTAEIDEKYQAFFDIYFNRSVMTSQEYDTACTKFCNFANAVEANAFEVGFYAAVKLLTGGRQI